MARVSSYRTDTVLNDKDRLIVSSYEGEGQAGAIYVTNNILLSDLADYLNLNFDVDDVNYNLNLISSTVTSHTSALATINTTLSTHTSDISANASYSTNLAATFGTFDDDGNLQTLAQSFANQVFSTTSSTIFAQSSYVNNLGSSFGTVAADGTVTISEAFADSVITTTASDRFATTTSVNTLTSTVEGKPDIFRQDDAPATTNPVGSIWYDTNDNNKVYVLVSGTPNVWTETSDDRIVTNSQSISSVNQSVTTLNNSLTAEAALIDELQTQFTFDTNGGITGTADALNTSISTAQSNAESASASKVDTLASKFFTGYNNATGGFTAVNVSEAFANEIFDTTTSTNFASSSSLSTLSARVDTAETDIGNNETNISAKPSVFRQDAEPSTTGVADKSLWYDTDDNNKLYVLNSGTWTATFDGRIATNASNISTNTSNISNNVTALGLRPRVFRQNAEPSTSGLPANSLWYDTDDNNKLYIYNGSSWVLTDDSRIGNNVTSIANANTSITANADAITARTSRIEELESQFTFDSNDSITGVADALSTSISTTATSAAGAVATDLDKLEAVFSFDANNNVDGIQGALSTAVTSNANTAISNASLASAADVTELQSQFTFTNGNITGVTDALATSISTTASNAAGAVATDLDKLEAVFSFDANGNVDGTAGALSTAVTSSANTAIANANLATTSELNTLESTVNTKPQIYRQTSQPSTTGVPANSLWYDTDDNNKLYVLVSGTWTATVDGTIATAQATANSRPKVFRQTGAPATSEPASSIWYDTDDNNKVYILISGTWTATDDSRIATNTANITENSSTIAEVDGYAQSRYSLQATAGGIVTGMSILSESNGNYSTSNISEVKFQADKFIVNSASTNLTPFSISGSKIKFNGDIDVTGTALIQGTDTTNNEFTAVKIVNNGTTNGKVGMKLQNSAGYFAQFFLDTTTENNINNYGFDLQLGPASGGGVNTVAHFNAGGLCVPAGTSTSTYNGRSIFFNSDNAARNEDSARMHVNNYMTTLFIDLPDGDATNGYGGHTNTRLQFRRWNTSTSSDSTIAKVDNNNAWHLGTIYAYNSTTYLADLDNTGDSLKVAGDVVAYVSSDKRYKDNIVNISNPLDKLNKINGVSFTWNEISHKETGKKDIGVVAQEIEEIFPEIVQTRENGYKAVDYPKLTALLIEAVKELSDKVKALEDGVTK